MIRLYNFLNSIQWGELTGFAFWAMAALIGVSVSIEKLTGIKNPLAQWAKRFIKAVGQILKTGRMLQEFRQESTANWVVAMAAIKEVKEEVKYNGGKRTMVDAVKTIEALIAELTISTKTFEATERASYEVSAHPMFENNAMGDLVYVNAEWEYMTGATFEEVRGAGWLKVIPKEDRADLIEINKSSVNTVFRGTVRFQHLKTGKITNTFCVTSPIFHPITGMLVKTIGMLKTLD